MAAILSAVRGPERNRERAGMVETGLFSFVKLYCVIVQVVMVYFNLTNKKRV